MSVKLLSIKEDSLKFAVKVSEKLRSVLVKVAARKSAPTNVDRVKSTSSKVDALNWAPSNRHSTHAQRVKDVPKNFAPKNVDPLK